MSTPIPKPPGVPLLGNISDVDPANTWVSLQKLWEKYGQCRCVRSLVALRGSSYVRRNLQDIGVGPADRLRRKCSSLRGALR